MYAVVSALNPLNIDITLSLLFALVIGLISYARAGITTGYEPNSYEHELFSFSTFIHVRQISQSFVFPVERRL